MRINKLILENFKQYKSCEIIFPDGLLGFVGKNGAGKSTIFEAIYLALYGKYGQNNDRMKNDFATSKEPIVIELHFEDNNTTYKIIREFRGKGLTAKAELFFGDNEISDIVGVTDVNKKVTKILKIDAVNFKNSFFSEQKEVTALIDLKTGDRQKQLRKMLGLARLDKLGDKINAKSNEMKINLKNLESRLLNEIKIEELNNLLQEKKEEKSVLINNIKNVGIVLTNALDDYENSKVKVINAEKIKENFKKLESENKVVNSKINLLDENIKNLEKKLIELNNNKVELNELLPQKQQYEKTLLKYEELLGEQNLFTKKNNLLEKIAESKITIDKKNLEIENLNVLLLSFDGLETKIEKNILQKTALENLLNASNRTKTEIFSHISTITKEIKEKTIRINKLKELGVGSPCPECQRPLGEEYYGTLYNTYITAINDLNKLKIEKENLYGTIEEEINKNKTELQKLTDDFMKLNRAISDKKNCVNNLNDCEYLKQNANKNLLLFEQEYLNYKDVTFDEAELKEIKNEKEILKKINDKYLAIESLITQIPEYENNKSKAAAVLLEYRQKNTEINKLINQISYNEDEFLKIKEERENNEKRVKQIEQEVHKYQLDDRETSNQIKLIEKDLADNNKILEEVNVCKKETFTYEKLISFIKDFKTKLTSHELPAISDIANKLFAEITKGRYFGLAINEDFSFSVIRDNNNVPLETLSGGEKDLASICLRIAISKRIAALAGRKNMGFLALDEVFSSQDQNRREELINTFQAISKDFKQIFVITHNQDVEEVFPSRLVIQKTGNYSYANLI
ncbi:MAG: SMC family ATPase [bacterium]